MVELGNLVPRNNSALQKVFVDLKVKQQNVSEVSAKMMEYIDYFDSLNTSSETFLRF